MVVISVYTYGVKIIKKFRWESGFLKGGSMEPPSCTNGSAGYLMQLSVKSIFLRNRSLIFAVKNAKLNREICIKLKMEKVGTKCDVRHIVTIIYVTYM